ncbi:MAG: MATE family efflux transporter [Alphaproteobacteria bacterium]|nr:MATE family efflux transporter [Alphaproteobacteria bacterium]
MRPVHPFTIRHRDVWSIALPATFAFITEPLAGLTDLTVIGRLGDAGLLGGVVLGSVVVTFVFAAAFFLRMSTAGLTAQAIGAKARDDGLIHLMRATILGIGLGVLAIALGKPIEMIGAVLMAPPPETVPAYELYFGIRLVSTPFVLVNFALLGWFYGRAAATTGMLLQMLIHGVNIVLSVGFVYGLGWGVAGVAWATVLGQVAAALTGGVLVLRHFGGFKPTRALIRLAALIDPLELRRLFGLGRDLTIRTLLLEAVYAFFAAQTARLGDISLAANHLLLHVLMVIAYFLDGQAQAAEQLCGKAVGANYRPAFGRAVRLTLGWGLGIGFGLFALVYGFGGMLIDFMSTNADIRAAARDNLVFAALTAFTGVFPFVFDGVATGATLNAAIRNGMLFSVAVYVAAALVLQPLWGLTGLWVSLHVFFLGRGFYLAWATRRSLDRLFPS